MATMQLTGVVVDRFSYLPVFAAAGVFPLVSLAALFLFIGQIGPIQEDRLSEVGLFH